MFSLKNLARKGLTCAPDILCTLHLVFALFLTGIGIPRRQALSNIMQ